MKKRIRRFFLCVIIIIAAVISAFFIKESGILHFEREATLSFFTGTYPDTTDTTVPETTEKATEAATLPSEPPTLIDINSLTVIDLYPLSLAGGGWDVKHCQGITVDKEKGYIYYSYTSLLVKCDMDGNIIGTVTGFTGHLGDIAFNEKDSRIYCGYYSKNREGFYVLIFDADKITKENMKPKSDVVRSVFVSEAYNDYKAAVTLQTEGGALWKKHRYGCSGIDGITFGPDFSKGKGSEDVLTLAYGIYSEPDRTDNDYQVLLQYDVTDWWDTVSKPHSEKELHFSAATDFRGKYFVYTGNTKYGVQTMEYFDELNLWILNCYHGQKDSFKKLRLFAIDGDVPPKKETLRGQPQEDKQYVLSLYQDGCNDKENGIYGWDSSYGVQGVAYMNDGLFYIVRPYESWTGTKTAICYLNVWSPDNNDPFVLAAGIGNDYSISKKPRVTEAETTAEVITEETALTESVTEKETERPALPNIFEAILGKEH